MPTSGTTDNYLWLENIEGDDALKWVNARNQITLTHFSANKQYESRYNDALAMLNDTQKIIIPELHGDYVYNLWKDANNPRGLYRRIKIDDYINTNDNWEILINLDILAQQENKNWVYSSVQYLQPNPTKCIIYLSDGGKDASVAREFDLTTTTFVPNGFELIESKSSLTWIDNDNILLCSALTPEEQTNSGYAKVCKLWKRGENPVHAKTIFTCNREDITLASFCVFDNSQAYYIIEHTLTFYESDAYLFNPTTQLLTKIPIPNTSKVYGIHKNKIIFELKRDWQQNNKTFISGSLLSVNINEICTPNFLYESLFVPNKLTSLNYINKTSDQLILIILNNINSELYLVDYNDKQKWHKTKIAIPPFGSIDSHYLVTSDFHTNFFYIFENFLTPKSLYYYNTASATAKIIRANPHQFCEENFGSKPVA